MTEGPVASRLGTQIGEVTCGWSLHLSCTRDQIKVRHYMGRQVTPPKRVTLPTWGPPPPCKQALNLLFCLVLVRLLLSSKAVLCDVNDIVAAQGYLG